jgi:citrate lyase subunit beta/citryl-CoA lyase
MRRSLLFIPSNTPAMMQNADVFDADAVIFDLEDAVFLSEKDAALSLLSSFIDRFKFEQTELIVRINGLDTHLGIRDLKTIVSDAIDTIMLPKATFKRTQECLEHLLFIETQKKMNKQIKIIPIIENALSLTELTKIAALDRVDGLLLGAEDLATDLEVERSLSGIEILVPRSMVVIAAKAYGIDAIDTPFIDAHDLDGLDNDALFAKSIGMNAKACIHPNQIDVVHHVFSPSQKEIHHAQKIIKALHEATLNNKGVFSVDGKMVDKPIIDRAKKILDKARKWGIIHE